MKGPERREALFYKAIFQEGETGHMGAQCKSDSSLNSIQFGYCTFNKFAETSGWLWNMTVLFSKEEDGENPQQNIKADSRKNFRLDSKGGKKSLFKYYYFGIPH